MPSLYTIKEQEVLDTPIVLFECSLRDGSTQYWSSHNVVLDGHTYNARVLSHNLFELRYGGDSVSDSSGRLSLSLANADAYFAQIDRSTGWKGATIVARFTFFDLSNQASPSGSRILFAGIWSGLDESNESVVRISFQNRLGMQRQLLPSVRIQRRCPWLFPSTEIQRLEAQTGGPEGIYSRFYNCGYSAGQPGGVGNLNAGAPYASCDFTRSACTARGMFDVDDGGIATRRFGGMEFLPVRLTQEKQLTAGNEAAYSGFVPLIYGTAWYQPPVVVTKQTPEYTKLEVLLGLGPIQGVLKVLVNSVELPASQPNKVMDSTGRYQIGSLGERTGAFDPEISNPDGTPLGNPYGSMAYAMMSVPASLYNGSAIPKVEVLVDGLQVQRFDDQGGFLDHFFTNNPAWIALDVLRRTGWKLRELDIPSFALAASVCDEAVTSVGYAGEALSIPRWRFNVALVTRRSASEVLRGLRNACGLYLKHGPDGRLQAGIEDTLAKQHIVKPDGSNSVQTLNNGWPAYEFGDGTYGFSGIARRPNGEPSLRFWSRSLADTPNRLSLQFQDEFNLYQKDSLSLTDIDDVVTSGQEISATISALGIANFSQAARILTTHLKKSVEGNRYVQFETSVRGIGLSPGDIITITYAREQMDRAPFRVLTIAPALDCSSLRVTAQLHSDEWYVTGMPLASDAAVAPRSDSGVPRPVLGTVLDAEGILQYEVMERALQETDGGVSILLSTSFTAPTAPAPSFSSRPRLSLRPQTTTGNGTLAGGKTYYYGVTALDAAGSESSLSFLASAALPSGTNTCSVTLGDLNFPTGSVAFNVYRGEDPQILMRIGLCLPISVTFLDDGKTPAIAPAPDENYDHANVYWRYELHPPIPATVYTDTTIGNPSLSMAVNEFAGQTVTVTSGRGQGQERTIQFHTGTVLTVSPKWTVTPDASSTFTIADRNWQFATRSKEGTAEFTVPNRDGMTIHVSVRAANARDEECMYSLSPLTRRRLTGDPGTAVDSNVPPAPFFGLQLGEQGTFELVSVSFADLTNTRNVDSGNLTVHYWDEINGRTPFQITSGVSANDAQIEISPTGTAQVGDFLQVNAELLQVASVPASGARYGVVRGALGSLAAPINAGEQCYHLMRKTYVVPFQRDFFGSPASGSYSYNIFQPDVRIAAAELFVTNSRGNSPARQCAYTSFTDCGLRTLSGGQYSLQVSGYLAVQSSAAPQLIIESTHSIRDVLANVVEAPAGADIHLTIRLDGLPFCSLTIADGSLSATPVNGFGLAPLHSQGVLTLDIASVPEGGETHPGRDLTVTIRI
ncbi:MAG: hypothetical protein IT167_02855 [Bryobacterales bacterium]|nr:hypothetical protein [Bryobacterales bacterium]